MSTKIKAMKTMASTELLSWLTTDVSTIIQTINTEFQPLTAEVLNWQPTPKKWSVLACLAHLNLTGHEYLPKIEDAITKALAQNNYPPQNTFTPNWLGNMAANSMKPSPKKKISYKMPTFSILKPAQTTLDKEKTIKEFLKQQEQFLALLKKANQVNLQKIKVSSFVGSIVSFQLGDIFRFLIAHSQRHVLQAQNVYALYQKK